MKPLLLHGDNTGASRAKLNEFKDEYKDGSVILDGKTISLEQLIQNLESGGFFAPDQLLIVENLSQNKSLGANVVIDKSTRSVIFWEEKKLGVRQLKDFYGQVSQLTTLEFKEDPVVFKFLDALAPRQQVTFLPYWKKYRKSTEPEIISTMLARQIRFLILASEKCAQGPDEWQNLAPWQKGKLATQAKKFTPEKLSKFQAELLDTDYKFKSSLLPIDLTDSIELLLLSL